MRIHVSVTLARSTVYINVGWRWLFGLHRSGLTTEFYMGPITLGWWQG